MRFAIAIALLVFFSVAPLRAQQAGEVKVDERAAHPEKAKDRHAGMHAEWKKITDHWAMVKAASGSDKAEHLEMHRTMLDGFMAKLAAHHGGKEGAEMKEGEGPTVGERSEKDEGDHAGETREHHAAEEAKAHHEARKSSLAELQAHWDMVKGLQDHRQLETHLAMHMEMLEHFFSEMKPAAMGHEGKPHEGAEHKGAEHKGAEHEGGGGQAQPPSGESGY